MKTANRIVALLFILVVFQTKGIGAQQEVLWLKLEKLFSYRDIQKFCSTMDFPPRIFLGIELANGCAKAVVLKTDTFEPFSRKLFFTQNESKEVKIGLDSKGRKWVESFKLNFRQIEWIFNNAGGFDKCSPSQKLATLNPSNFTYFFDLSQSGGEQPTFLSSLGEFSGKRQDGHFYEASLQFIQKSIDH